MHPKAKGIEDVLTVCYLDGYAPMYLAIFCAQQHFPLRSASNFITVSFHPSRMATGTS